MNRGLPPCWDDVLRVRTLGQTCTDTFPHE
jgi:hypothetical protein